MIRHAHAVTEQTGAVDDGCMLVYYGREPGDWEEAADDRHFVEFVDGRLLVHSPANLPHQEIFDFVYRLLGNHVERADLGKVLAGPFAMDLGAERKFEPDVMFLSHRTRANLGKDRLVGPADLCIEIASRGTRAYDRGEKRDCYRVGAVREYWMIDGFDRTVTLDRPAGNEVLRVSQGWVISETCPGFGLQAEWLFADPLPRVADCLRELEARRG